MNLATILVYGDIHLNSKNYGGHKDYANESLGYFQKITETAQEIGATHIIGLGDFTFSRFHTLEYRSKVEDELEKQYKLTNGNRFELKGNHDAAGYGMTEYEYYVEKGLLRPSTNLQIGNVNISMVDNGLATKTNILPIEEDKTNIVLAHDYFKFKDTVIPDYGAAIELDKFDRWFGIDYLVCGHIHKQEVFSGYILKGDQAHETVVVYPGCMSRPAFRKGHMDSTGMLLKLTISDTEEFKFEAIQIPLLPIEDSFNIRELNTKAEKKEEKRNRVDISDVVNKLNTHEGAVGNPEDIIMAMQDVDEKYRRKAIELLKSGQA